MKDVSNEIATFLWLWDKIFLHTHYIIVIISYMLACSHLKYEISNAYACTCDAQ